MSEINSLEEIRKRDAESVSTWFKEPALGACGRAHIDRRFLLKHIDTLLEQQRSSAPVPLCNCPPGQCNDPVGEAEAGRRCKDAATNAAALADAHRMYEKEHGEEFKPE